MVYKRTPTTMWVGRTPDGDIYSPIRNHRGDVCVLLDSHGDPTTTYRYDAFGEFTSHGAVKSPWLFSGQRYDAKIGLFHFAKREYDPFIGRWLTPDPLGFADGPNLYAYVHNNPLINVDPYGLWGESLSKWYKNTMQFTGSFTRGFADDTTFGATGYMFGERSHSSISSKIGYYTGTGCSMAAGLMYGGTWLKGARYGGKAALNAYKLARGAHTASKTTKNVLATKKVVKLAQEAQPELKRIVRSLKKNSIITPTRKEFLNRFHQAASQLSETGQNNIRILRNWAKNKGWTKYSCSGAPEKWGAWNPVTLKYEWNLIIKPEASIRPGLHPRSALPRFDARMGRGNYINPFTGKTGNANIGTHIPLE